MWDGVKDPSNSEEGKNAEREREEIRKDEENRQQTIDRHFDDRPMGEVELNQGTLHDRAIDLQYPNLNVKRQTMSSSIEQRLRILSHDRIKRQINDYRQRIWRLSGRIDRTRTCRYNAGSAFLLCAVNPGGPCATCSDYDPET